MALDAWPDDLLLYFADETTNGADLNALVQTNRRLYGTLNDLLHTRFARTLWRWIAEHGVASTAQKRRLRLILLSEPAKGHLESIKLFLGVAGIDVDAANDDEDGRTPLSWAAEEGHADVVRFLLGTGQVDVDTQEECGLTALSRAAAQGRAEVVRILLDTGRVNLDQPLLYAAEEGHADVVQMLLDTRQVNVDAAGERGRTPLSLACAGGHAGAVRVLLDTGRATVDSPDEQGRTPLWWAVRGGHSAVVRMLLSTGRVAIDSPDEQGRTPLWWALREGHADVVQILDTGLDDPGPFKVGVVGYTGSAKYFHIPLITATPQFKLHSIAERNPAEGNSAQLDHPEVTHHADADALLSDPEVDVVVITTSCDTHFELTKAALEAGKHVLVGKAFAHTSAEAESLMALAKSRGRLLCVHQDRRWASDFLVMKHLISNRVLGYVHEIRAHLDPCVRSAVEELRTPSGGGAIFDLGTDLIDQLYSLFGMPAVVSRLLPSYLTTWGASSLPDWIIPTL
ncbi:uncharacterized protein DNG_02054 [Cephalotrichum gorgonifer]|uniref:Gfo/Idh/MocA-like oxidoreductase N-terminal domain-containing protein n=1 Tax=Cephalotrichum gorgonifer TaxID=2041049 RepID=A0AAE8MSN9_9PEZI|nr:uncharacterized protein DNG_02054 [Cephalotrichum gorgonifer]